MPQSIDDSGSGAKTPKSKQTKIMGSSGAQAEEISKLQNKLQELKKALEETQGQLEQAQQDKKSLQATIDEQNQTMEQLQQQIQGLSASLEQTINDPGTSKAHDDRLQALQTELDQNKGELEAVNAALEQTQAKEQEAAEKIKKLQLSLEQAQQEALDAAKATALTGADQAAKIRIAELEAAKAGLEQDVANLNSAATNLRNQLDQTNNRVSQIEQAKLLVDNQMQAMVQAQQNNPLAKEIDKERSGKRTAILIAVLAFITACVLLLILAASKFGIMDSLPKLDKVLPAQEDKTSETVDIAMNPRNLQLYFGDTDPACVPGKVEEARPNSLGMICQGKQTYDQARDCTDVSQCTISLPKKFSAGGEFPVTAENLAAISSQSDPTCYRHNTGTRKSWPMDSIRIAHCERTLYDRARNCYDYSAESCRIVIPAPTR